MADCNHIGIGMSICNNATIDGEDYCKEHLAEGMIDAMKYESEVEYQFPRTARKGYSFDIGNGLLITKTLKIKPDLPYREVPSGDFGDKPKKVYRIYVIKDQLYECVCENMECCCSNFEFCRVEESITECDHNYDCKCINSINCDIRYRKVMYIPEF